MIFATKGFHDAGASWIMADSAELARVVLSARARLAGSGVAIRSESCPITIYTLSLISSPAVAKHANAYA